MVMYPKPAHRKLLDAAAVVQPQSLLEQIRCSYCAHKYSQYCSHAGITPVVTPNCKAGLIDRSFYKPGVIPDNLRQLLRKDRKEDSSTAMRNVAVGVLNFPCCPSCCMCVPCSEKVTAVALIQSPPRKGRLASQLMREQHDMYAGFDDIDTGIEDYRQSLSGMATTHLWTVSNFARMLAA